MSTDLADGSVAADREPAPGRLSRILGAVLLVGLGVLLVEIMLEAWVQEILSDRFIDAGNPILTYIGDVPGWPKDLKNGIVIGLVLVGVLKITLDRRWREFITAADIALVVLAVVLAVAGFVNDASATLVGEALFVYFRGAVVFYAVRALAPTWQQFRPVLWAGGIVLGVSLIVAFVQVAVGTPAYEAVGWIDLQYARLDRAHGLFDHPNNLGHALALVAMGMAAWMTGMPRPSWRWWVGFTVVALGLAATQSRESWLATTAGIVVIWFLRRQGGRVMLIAVAMLSVFFLGHLLSRPGNLAELKDRLGGVANAVETPSGTEDCDGFETNDECINQGRVQPRESRILFYQQGAGLLADRPFLGYGVGHFGGIVAETNDPSWDKHPRFGPDGFDLHDYDGTTVDSFWLHLTVEAGLLGLLAYLAWLALVTRPLVRATRRFAAGARSTRGSPGRPLYAAASAAHPAVYWASAAMVFAVFVAFLSPALEDPMFPMMLFGIMGLGWVMNRRNPGAGPATAVTPGPPAGRGEETMA
jgi:O-antigen ligase